MLRAFGMPGKRWWTDFLYSNPPSVISLIFQVKWTQAKLIIIWAEKVEKGISPNANFMHSARSAYYLGIQMHFLCQLRICLAELQEMTEQRAIIKIAYQHNIRTTSNYDQKDYKSQQTHITNQQNLHNPYPQLTKRQEKNPVKKSHT